MEARLKDFVSGQLKIVQNSVVAFGQEGRKAFASLSEQVKENEKSFGSMFAKIAGGIVSAGMLIKFAKDSVGAFQEQEQANIQLEARLTATGHASGFVAEELEKMAGELQKTTKFS